MRGKKSEARPVTLSKNLQHIYNNIDIIGKKSIFSSFSQSRVFIFPVYPICLRYDILADHSY